MGGKSKTGAKASAVASKVAKAHKPVVARVSKPMRKLLARTPARQRTARRVPRKRTQ